jgi:hypothetical protein
VKEIIGQFRKEASIQAGQCFVKDLSQREDIGNGCAGPFGSKIPLRADDTATLANMRDETDVGEFERHERK